MIQFSFRAKVDRDPKWGPKGRRFWLSDCGKYRIEQRFEYQGLEIRRRERWLALCLFGPQVLGRSLTKKAAIARCTQHANRVKRKEDHGTVIGSSDRSPQENRRVRRRG